MNNDSIQILERSIKASLKPHGNVDLIQWVKENVAVTSSHKGSTVDFNLTPYFKEPFQEFITNPNLEEMVIAAGVGIGKTTFLTALGVVYSALFPRQLMFVAQSESMVTDFLELNLKPSLKKNKTVKRIWPTRNKDRRDGIHFPTHSIFTGSAQSIGSLQSRSIDILAADEIWLFEKDGVIEEMRRRLHNRPGARCCFVSQGSIYGDQFETTYSSGLIKKYAWLCDCGSRNIYKFEDIKFDCEKTEEGETIWSTVKAEMECPCCQKRYADTPKNRRKLSESGIYVIENPEQNYLPGHVSYNITQLSVFDIEWSKLALEFLKANASLSRAVEIRQFRQKKLAEFYNESSYITEFDLTDNESAYSMDQYKNDRWDKRIITVDVQLDRLYVCIRDWSNQGKSRLVAYNYASTFSDIERMRIEYESKSKEVFLDSAYRTEEVKLACAQYGWLGMNGLKDNLFRVKNKQGKMIERLFSAPVTYPIKWNGQIRNVQVVNYAGTSVKDTLCTLMGKKDMWLLPNGGEHYENYIHQLNSEIRDINQKTGKAYYRKVKDQNHAFDTETMQIVAAMVWEILQFGESEVVDN